MKEFTLSNKQLEIYSSFILIMYCLLYTSDAADEL